MRRDRIAVVVLATALATTPVTALADTPPQATALCETAPHGCSIRVSDATREGATVPVGVDGAPGVRLRVMAYQAVVTDGTLTALEPLGPGVDLVTPSSGSLTADLSIPGEVGQPSSGWVLVSVDGLQGTDASTTLGSWAPFGTRRPTVLGDGFGDRKPVGRELDLHVIGAIPRTEFTVELENTAGSWVDVRTGNGVVATAANEVATLHYTIPRGLPATAHRLRLRNVTDTAISATWLAVPDADGTPQADAPVFTPPPVGGSLTGTAQPGRHPRLRVTGITLGLSAAVVAAVALDVALPLTRRRRPVRGRHG